MAYFNLKIKKAINFLNKNALLLSILIVIISFLFSRLPFFIWAPIPEFGPDSFEYFGYVNLLNKSNLINFTIIPPGYPLFLYSIGLFSNKIITVIYIQNLLSLLTALMLVIIVYRYYKNIAIYVSIALSIFYLDSFALALDSTLYTESVYTSILIIICGLLIWAINSNKKVSWLLLSGFLVVPALIRPNGIFIYFVLIYLIVYFIFNKYPKVQYLYLIIPFLLLNTIWSAYNYQSAGVFFTGSPKRIQSYYQNNQANINKLIKENKDEQPGIIKYIIKVKLPVFKEYITNINKSYWHFYYHTIPTRYHNLYKEDLIHNKEVLAYWCRGDTMTAFRETGRLLMFKEFYNKGDVYKDEIKHFDKDNKTNNLWVFLYHIYYYIHEKIFRNLLWLFLYFSILIVSSFLIIKNKFRDKELIIINIICLIHLISVVVICTHDVPWRRYVYVTEFVYYLVPALSILLLQNRYKGINTKKLKKKLT